MDTTRNTDSSPPVDDPNRQDLNAQVYDKKTLIANRWIKMTLALFGQVEDGAAEPGLEEYFARIILEDGKQHRENSVFASLVGQTTAHLTQLINQDSKLEDLLEACRREVTDKILADLRNYVSTTTLPKGATSNKGSGLYHDGTAVLDVTKKAWVMEYTGDSAERFAESLHGMMNQARSRGKDYSNFVPIVQSSGMGKSRLVDQAATYIFTLPFNLRDDADTSAYPKPDSQVRDFLLRNTQHISSTTLELRYLKFFKKLFSSVTDAIKRKQPKRQSAKDFATGWREQIVDDTFRQELYSKAMEDILTTRDEMSPKEDILRDAKTDAAKALTTLLAAIETRTLAEPEPEDKNGSRRVSILLTFDESHTLFGMATRHEEGKLGRPAQEPRAPYHVLCRSFNALQSCDMLAVFLSTNSNLNKYSPNASSFWSLRGPVGVNEQDLLAPYVELPFDIFAKVEKDKLKIKDVSTLPHMVRFGRPLWYTRWKAATDAASPVLSNFFDFAIQKIFAVSNPRSLPGSNRDAYDNGLLAALCIRLQLEFDTKRENARDLEAKQVAGHMRVCYSVPKHLEYMYTGTPSEPILAEAAARIMHGTGGAPKNDDLVTHLVRRFEDGLISKGERGEIVARLLLTLAHDKVIHQRENLGPDTHADVPAYSKPIPVLDFLESLFGSQHSQKIRKSLPTAEVYDTTTLEDAFEHATLNFTHFVRASDESVVSDRAAWKAFTRGMAYIGHPRQPAVDFIIPILLWDTKPLGTFVVSAILVQIKNRKAWQKITNPDATQLKFFTTADSRHGEPEEVKKYNIRPYITILIDLGGEGDSVQVAIPKDREIHSGGATAPPVHRRYTVSARGCSKDVYDMIGERLPQYRKLLAGGDLLDEHPRQDRIDDVIRLKPHWGARSFSDWIKDPDVDKKKKEEVSVEAAAEGSKQSDKQPGDHEGMENTMSH